jgi:hypothetical protein
VIPEGLDALILSLLSRDPGGRPQSALALLARVEALRARLATPWTDARARAWWREHLPELAEPREQLVL